ncbi:MAG: abortive infection family protein [Pseudomonadota bacterium]
MSNTIPKQVRKNIFDGLALDEIRWCGRLPDDDFLARIFDLEELPSTDSRFSNAAGDIHQHRIFNWDWEDDWIYTDRRFDLLNCPDEQFLAFLVETVHPLVRPEKSETATIVAHYNEQLGKVGWELCPAERIAGRARFVAQRVYSSSKRSISRGQEVSRALDSAWMAQEIARIEASVETDPALAIGTAKDLVETCCKSILNDMGVAHSKTASLQSLSKLVVKELKLVPEDISDQAKGAENIRLLLRNLASIAHYLAELRGLYGSGHGRDGNHRGLQPRHAKLIVGSAVVFVDFLAETYRERGKNGEIE